MGTAKYTSDDGATFTRIWGKHCALLRVLQNPGRKSQTFGVTISETIRSTGTVFDGTRGEKGSTMVKTTGNSQQVVMASDVGYLITDATA